LPFAVTEYVVLNIATEGLFLFHLNKPISELRNVTYHTGSHSVSCHPTQANATSLNPSQTYRYSIYLPYPGGI